MTARRPLRSASLILSILAAALALTASGALAHPADPDEPNDGKVGLAGTSLDSFDRAVTVSLGPAKCEDGRAAIFPCRNVDLESFIPLEELGGGTGNDIWGWTDPQTGKEYAIMGTSNGTSFIDVTDPQDPVVVGKMLTQSAVFLPLWRDIKVHDNHAFVVSEHSRHGMQVFDLTRLRDIAVTPTIFTPDTVYNKMSKSHNISINTETGYAYAVGTNTCEGGLHMIDVNDPKNPQLAGCFSQDGYTHDVECVVYEGPDGRFRGQEICFASNEDTVTIVDVTDKANPTMLSRTGYPEASYTHQGSLTPDQRFFLFGDELDEQGGTQETTTTYILEAGSLTAPGAPVGFNHETQAIDHNLYTHGKHVYESNYTAGLRILEQDRKSLQNGQMEEVAFFDVVPGTDIDEFAGTWSNYRFDSGTTVVSTLELGLFVLKPTLEERKGGRGRK
jgi:choice-of-anchor B domain-containing protein